MSCSFASDIPSAWFEHVPQPKPSCPSSPTALLAAWQLARENYGCGLDRLDEEEVQWYLDRLTEANFEETASDLAYAGWFAY